MNINEIIKKTIKNWEKTKEIYFQLTIEQMKRTEGEILVFINHQ